MSERADDPMTTFLVAQSLSGELLRVHVDDGTGHCAGCSWQQRARPVHPCPTRCYAERAAENLRARHRLPSLDGLIVDDLEHES